MLSLADFLAVVLAAGGVIEAWNKGSVFATTRAKLQAIQDVTEPETFKGRVLELLSCPFCQSYHVPFWLLVVLLASPLAGATIDSIVRLVVYGLAATRLVNLLDQFLPPHMRHKPPQGNALGHTTN